MGKKGKTTKIEPFSYNNDDLDYQSISKSWDIDLSSSSDSFSLPDDKSNNSSLTNKSKKNKKIKAEKHKDENTDDIYVDNLANLGRVITINELFIDTLTNAEIDKLPCSLLESYGKRFIELKKEKDILINQLNYIGIDNPNKIISRIQKVPIYCKKNKIIDKTDDNIKENDSKNDDQLIDTTGMNVYMAVINYLVGIILLSIAGYIVYQKYYNNK